MGTFIIKLNAIEVIGVALLFAYNTLPIAGAFNGCLQKECLQRMLTESAL